MNRIKKEKGNLDSKHPHLEKDFLCKLSENRALSPISSIALSYFDEVSFFSKHFYSFESYTMCPNLDSPSIARSGNN